MSSAMLTPAELVWLMAAVAKGDQPAFERLYAATRAKLYGVALRILRRSDLADEVIQETYLKIWHNAGSFDPKLATPITWMVAIARNRALDLIRKKGETSIEDEPAAMEAAGERSEEHTSELQSPCNLVCRLLLEKKKKKNLHNHIHFVMHLYYTNSSNYILELLHLTNPYIFEPRCSSIPAHAHYVSTSIHSTHYV